MNYYLLLDTFDDGEGTFTIQDPFRSALDYYQPQLKLFKATPLVKVDACYKQRGMSDFLKIGGQFLASRKVQSVFFEHGFQGVQFVPVAVDNKRTHKEFAFMNAICHYPLLDPVASKAKRYSEHTGGFARIQRPIFDKKKFDETIFEHDIFTLTERKRQLFVNEKVKHALEEALVTGISFRPAEFSS